MFDGCKFVVDLHERTQKAFEQHADVINQHTKDIELLEKVNDEAEDLQESVKPKPT